MIKRNQAWFWKIFRAIKSIIIFSLRMIAATVLGLMSNSVNNFEWYDNAIQYSPLDPSDHNQSLLWYAK